VDDPLRFHRKVWLNCTGPLSSGSGRSRVAREQITEGESAEPIGSALHE
jgi:hypothetical protein